MNVGGHTLCPLWSQDGALRRWLAGDVEALAAAALQLPALLDFPPTLVAAALLCCSRRAAGSYPAFPLSLALATGVSSVA